jgi:hypothetical protein
VLERRLWLVWGWSVSGFRDAQQQFFIDTGAMKKIVDVRRVFDFSYLDRAIARLRTQ